MMSIEVTQLNDTLEYLRKYQGAITEEGCSKEFKQIVDSIETFKLTLDLDTTNTTIKKFPNSSKKLFYDRFIRIIDSMVLPESAKTANRVFKVAVKKDLQNCSGISELKKFPVPHSLIDYMQNAQNYEMLAANSYTPNFIVNNLLCTLECLRLKKLFQQETDAFVLSEIQRIEDLLSALTDPMPLGYEIRYLLSGFKNYEVSFSIHHPRFIEIINDLRMAMKTTPNEEFMSTTIMHWVHTLKAESASQWQISNF